MDISPINFDLTGSEIRKIQEGWIASVYLKDYSDASAIYIGRLSDYYISMMKEYAQKHIEPDEKWVVKDLGLDESGFRQYDYRLYKGLHPKCGRPRSLHLKIRFTLHQLRHQRSGALAAGGWVGGILGGLIKGLADMICALSAIFVVNSFSPPKEGESTFGRDFLVAWGTLEFLDAQDRRAELEARVAQLESERHHNDDDYCD